MLFAGYGRVVDAILASEGLYFSLCIGFSFYSKSKAKVSSSSRTFPLGRVDFDFGFRGQKL